MFRNEENIYYIMMNNDNNRRLFHRDLVLRYNGMVTIVTFTRILAPHPIIKEMQGIPLVFSDAPTLIMKNPTVFPNYIIKNDIKGNNYGVTILNNTTLGIHRTQEMQPNCTGKNCNLSKAT